MTRPPPLPDHFAPWLAYLRPFGVVVTFTVDLSDLDETGSVMRAHGWSAWAEVGGKRYEGNGRHGLAALQSLAAALPDPPPATR